MVKGMPKLSHSTEVTTKGCARDKNAKKPFHQSESRAKEILALMHSDLCEPMSVASPSVFLYYVICIDDCSIKTCIYLLKPKEYD